MRSFVLSPEVPGELGPESVVRHGASGIEVDRPHLSVTSWLGDDLVECFPCFFVSQRLAALLGSSGISGWALAPALVTAEPDAFPGARRAPEMGFQWLRILGRDRRDDLSISQDRRLVASARALAVFRQCKLAHCEVAEIPADASA